MYEKILNALGRKPDVYEKSTAPFWDDFHISKGMLAAHLDVNEEGATRNYGFVVKSAAWIGEQVPDPTKAALLDLGCGPGVYGELFCRAGFAVTGVDFSQRSIDYAVRSAAAKGLSIDYRRMNYLEIDFADAFDLVTLIYCDFGVLCPADRRTLLGKARRALKPGGKLILDGFTERQAEDFSEGRTAEFCEEGFWAPQPYLCIQSNYRYPQTDNYLEQYLIVTREECQCYNLWNQIFDRDSLGRELGEASFGKVSFYDDVAGAAYTGSSATICAVAE